ncbi:MAG: GTPase ObgE [Pirellulales bacterium]|nr:GTPase ObgE [Pirellulales bacterium]
MFVDRVKIFAQGGRGGNGCLSFRREKYIPRGGPNGGDGGDGGSVILQAVEGVDSLNALSQRRHWNATDGQSGQGDNCHGRYGQDLTIQVPPGTVVRDADSQLLIKDLLRPGETVVIARGGRGGKGNTHFKSATNRAPRQTTPGEEGETRTLVLELKVIADVGLIGKPNAGKSTLLSRLSRARPEIAAYPFTTKYPNLGIVQLDADRSCVLADIPGLIEGAHAGVGLGHEFLRHVERAGILVHLVEPLPADETDPLENYRTVRAELELYDSRLSRRPEILVVTKCELPGAEQLHQQLAELTGREVLLLSAVTGTGLDRLRQEIARQLDVERAADSEPPEPAHDAGGPPGAGASLAPPPPTETIV